jgi:hypothetical protein
MVRDVDLPVMAEASEAKPMAAAEMALENFIFAV